MRRSILWSSLVTHPTLTAAARTFNVTAALAPGEWQKYHCLATDKLVTRLPSCVAAATIKANQQDGCAYDDFTCHCVNYDKYSSIIQPLVFPPSHGGHGSCTNADLAAARPVISDMCNFFNATLYAAYFGCGILLSEEKTLCTVAVEKVVITH